MKKVLLFVVLLTLCSCGYSSNGNGVKSSPHSYAPMFNSGETQYSLPVISFPQGDDRYATSYDYYKSYSESKFGYSGGWTLAYAVEDDIVMCSTYYKDDRPVIGIGDGESSIKSKSYYTSGGTFKVDDNSKNLKSIALSKNLQYINKFAFKGCSSLTKIVIPRSIIKVDDYAFYGCDNLTIYFESSGPGSDWGRKWNASDCNVVWGYRGD